MRQFFNERKVKTKWENWTRRCGKLIEESYCSAIYTTKHCLITVSHYCTILSQRIVIYPKSRHFEILLNVITRQNVWEFVKHGIVLPNTSTPGCRRSSFLQNPLQDCEMVGNWIKLFSGTEILLFFSERYAKTRVLCKTAFYFRNRTLLHRWKIVSRARTKLWNANQFRLNWQILLASYKYSYLHVILKKPSHCNWRTLWHHVIIWLTMTIPSFQSCLDH